MKNLLDNDLISVGMDLGIYTIGKLIASGIEIKPEAWKVLSQQAGASIERATDMPAEDLALMVQPIIDKMIEGLK